VAGQFIAATQASGRQPARPRQCSPHRRPGRCPPDGTSSATRVRSYPRPFACLRLGTRNTRNNLGKHWLNSRF
jgi:hypothetical protein